MERIVALGCFQSGKNLKTFVSFCDDNQDNDYLIVKLGGSAITYKNEFEKLHQNNLEICAKQISNVINRNLKMKVIIVHGAGFEENNAYVLLFMVHM
jgi:hypothetical protein